MYHMISSTAKRLGALRLWCGCVKVQGSGAARAAGHMNASRGVLTARRERLLSSAHIARDCSWCSQKKGTSSSIDFLGTYSGTEYMYNKCTVYSYSTVFYTVRCICGGGRRPKFTSSQILARRAEPQISIDRSFCRLWTYPTVLVHAQWARGAIPPSEGQRRASCAWRTSWRHLQDVSFFRYPRPRSSPTNRLAL